MGPWLVLLETLESRLLLFPSHMMSTPDKIGHVCVTILVQNRLYEDCVVLGGGGESPL